MSYLTDKLKSQALEVSEQKPIPIPEATIMETSLTSSDDDALKQIINNEFARRGIDIDDITTMSTTSIVAQGLMYLFDRTADIQSVQNIESNLLTAQKNTTLFNQLVQHTDEIVLAKPSKISVFVKIPFSEIIKHGISSGPGKHKFVFTTDNSILLDNLPFIPEYDMELMLTKTENKTELRVQYKVEEGYRNVTTQRGIDSDGGYYGVFKTPFVQLTLEKQEKTFNGSQIDRFIINTKKPISEFFLTYKDTTMSAPMMVDSKLYFTRGTDYYLKYRIHSNTKMSLEYIYGISSFSPISGGKLGITLLTTSGTNIRYRGDAVIEKRKPDNLLVEYIPTSEEFISTGGILASDDKEYIRSYIRKLKGTVLRIDTESDLKTYLGTYQGKSTFHPRLIVNDIRRIFNVYTLMSFENNLNTFTVPTTSSDLFLSLDRLEKKVVGGDIMYNLNGISIESIQSNKEIVCKLAPLVPTILEDDEDMYHYSIPFHITYNARENYIRCLLESSYNIPYDTYCIYDSDSIHVPTRFVNTTLRVNNLDIVDGISSDTAPERQFSISTEIRADNTDFVLTESNFKSEILFMSTNKEIIKIPMTSMINQDKDNKYTLDFSIETDGKVYDRYLELNALVEVSKGVFEKKLVFIDIEQKDVKLNLYTSKDNSDVNTDSLLVTTFTADVDVFIDVSRFVYLQSVITMTGDLKIPLCPMVEEDFFLNWRNKKNINIEMSKIFNFIEEEIYTDTDDYSSSGYSLRDRQETLFTTSIKFVKTHGRSKFLQLGTNKPLTNLQVAPSSRYRLLNDQFDLNKISSEYNRFLTTFDFLSADLHMNDLVSEFLLDYSSDIQMLQFVDFGEQYDKTDHMIVHNSLTYLNEDIPESVSLRPKFNDELDIYTYDVKYEEI